MAGPGRAGSSHRGYRLYGWKETFFFHKTYRKNQLLLRYCIDRLYTIRAHTVSVFHIPMHSFNKKNNFYFRKRAIKSTAYLHSLYQRLNGILKVQPNIFRGLCHGKRR